MSDSSRKQLLQTWLSEQFSMPSMTVKLRQLDGDAGFRIYYRFTVNHKNYIAVDAPSQWSNNTAFIQVQSALLAQNLSVPEIYFSDLSNGFFCLTDFGNTLFHQQLKSDNLIELYSEAIQLLPSIATAHENSDLVLPQYDEKFVLTELSIFSEWLINKHLDIHLSFDEISALKQCFSTLVDNVEAQPKVTMHRDFHSRNLMRLDNGALGIIDFQDAVSGPITYDIVSLLRDCYVYWPQATVYQLLHYYQQMLEQQKLMQNVSTETFVRWFDLMGVQRHLKAAGIFARLLHRDAKAGYVKDIPNTLRYVVEVTEKYPELAFLHQFVSKTVLPKLSKLVA